MYDSVYLRITYRTSVHWKLRFYFLMHSRICLFLRCFVEVEFGNKIEFLLSGGYDRDRGYGPLRAFPRGRAVTNAEGSVVDTHTYFL